MNVDMGLLFWSLMFVVIASVIIMYACDTFEGASTYLGRNMAPGVKGATINAIGSSMPELLTTAVFLFVYRDIDGFSAGVATAAGSAIFNGLIIPALCIIVVTTMGARVNGKMTKVSAIELDPKTIIRDGFWLLVSEAVLIYFLGDTILTWVTGTFLLLCYVGYFTHLMWYNKKYGGNNDDDEEEEEAEGEKSFLKGVLKFDFNYLIYKDNPFTTGSAVVVLSGAIVVLAVACLLLAKGVIMAADALRIPTYFTAVVLAAAATSVPDTILSLKDARNGNYDDAVANAVGSNIFDIAVSLGLPLLIFTLIFGSVELSAIAGETEAEVQLLRIVLFAISVVLIAILLMGRKAGLGKGVLLLVIFFGWLTWIADSAFQLGMFSWLS